MKLCISLFPLLYFFFLFVIFTSIYAAQDYDECQNNYSCSVITARYPFWGGNRPAFCGPPGFNLSCIENGKSSGGKYTAIDIDGMRFRVIEIDPTDYRLRIARSDLWKIPCSNVGILQNTSLDYSSFSFLKNASENLTLFYSCSGYEKVGAASIAPPGLFKCSDNGDNIVSSIYYVKDSGLGFYDGETWFGDCNKRSIKVPILNINIEKLDSEGSLNLQTYINQGFDVEYAVIGEMCQECEVCVYNEGFLCKMKRRPSGNQINS